ncbi:MAG: ricin-type beta-trefoil lectin domain protein [Oscillospiraceae bacterium]|nr:ricin-type beta-trefoil lectin domain protein [Oscillospiraceae bacterium]
MKKMSTKRILSSLLCFSIASLLTVTSVSAIELKPIDNSSVFNRMSMVEMPNATQPNSIQNNTIRINSVRNGNYFKQFWTDFGFFKYPDGTYRLKNIYNGIFYEFYQINSADTIFKETVFTFRNSKGEIYKTEAFKMGTKMSYAAAVLQLVELKQGDSIQILPLGDLGRNLAIGGYVNNNLSNVDYGYILDSYYGRRFSFRVEEDGLYNQYIDQTRIPDGNYMIETAENANKALTIISEDNSIKVAGKDMHDGKQQFNLTYDNVKKGYRIKNLYSNEYLSWNSTKGNDVIHFGGGDYSDQLWYLRKETNTNNYTLVNALNVDLYLNLDSNKTNISVASNRYSILQKFTFTKIEN